MTARKTAANAGKSRTPPLLCAASAVRSASSESSKAPVRSMAVSVAATAATQAASTPEASSAATIPRSPGSFPARHHANASLSRASAETICHSATLASPAARAAAKPSAASSASPANADAGSASASPAASRASETVCARSPTPTSESHFADGIHRICAGRVGSPAAAQTCRYASPAPPWRSAARTAQTTARAEALCRPAASFFFAVARFKTLEAAATTPETPPSSPRVASIAAESASRLAVSASHARGSEA
mmetsp:Transcript_15504/g.54090  ORF Transcript_15504/g.54090 Transcript_15504/m.54090 type:complete len:251 (-) Transcript_15504:2001-2753(-)